MIVSAALRSTNVTVSNAASELIAAAAQPYRLLEVGFSINAATASVFGLGAPAAIGVTPGTLITLLPEMETTSAGATQQASTWATSPTNPTNYNRRVSLPATIGAGLSWSFPRGFGIAKAKTLVLQNIIGGSVADIWWVVDE